MSTTTTPHQADPQAARLRLVRGYSLEMTARDVEQLEAAAPLMPAGAQVSVTFLPNEDVPSRVEAAAAIRRAGLTPAPHISARRLRSQAELEAFLDALAADAGVRHAFVIAGDPPRPEGPFEDALAIIKTGLLAKYGVRHVGISGYPEGHPDIPADKLWRALHDKHAALRDLGHEVSITTQFGFDAEPIFRWLESLREQGVDAPVRIGVAGPASVKTLLRFAARCGVGSSVKVMSRYGASLTRLLGTAAPDSIISEIAMGLSPETHGEVALHFYPFGGLTRTAGWIGDFQKQQGV